MDMASKKLPLAIIAVLIIILVAQSSWSGGSGARMVDPATCELWVRGDGPAGREYLGEFEQKCLDLKELGDP